MSDASNADTGQEAPVAAAAGGTAQSGATALTIATRAAIPLGYAVVVAVFVALGIQGDLFARLIRNDPGAVGASFTVAIIAVVVPLVAFAVTGTSTHTAARWIRIAADVLGAVLLVVAAVIAVKAGVESYGQREQPSLSVPAVSQDAQELATVQVSSSALSLRTADRMLLRVVAFSGDIGVNDAHGICRDTSRPEPDVEGVKLLYWGESGPTVTGSATASASVQVDTAEYPYVCALAVLTNQETDSVEATRLSSILIDVTAAAQE
ncbi:hypothetical protein [Microbacterium hominis]|uniref:Uncharacterized protein n=1 Tax=Microbacterium hominis TaxID=162426 RepID=A0A7D4PZC4_9MICO|nr:hypothetical protein [Microbacterium hominis]QKJ18058.1 hypothetical protein HQM25_00595 [Microbacterium hominis]